MPDLLISNLPGIAYELCGNNVSLVNLANASLHITSRFKSTRSVFLECVSEDKVLEYRRFDLPLSEISDHINGPELIEDDEDLISIINTAKNAFFVRGKDGIGTSVIHTASYHKGSEKIIHVIMFYKPGTARWSQDINRSNIWSSQSIIIWEDAKRSKYESKLDHFGEGAEFPKFVRAEGLVNQDHVNGFLLFKSFFERTMRSLTFVNSKLICSSWEKMLRFGGGSSDLPWERRRNDQMLLDAGQRCDFGSEVGTVSVSLDLRKSTYMMRQAQDRSIYAYWLEALAEIARDFTHRHGGIYDKFTGDGAISHFVYEAGDRDHSSRTDAICRAFKCAQDLVAASAMHLGNIEVEFDYLSGKSGPAVGLAYGPAAWSLDRDGRPVVVGSGVVNACRLCAGPSGSIRTTIAIRATLEKTYKRMRFVNHHLDDHKDLPASDDPVCGQLGDGVMAIGSAPNEIRARVDAIWDEVKARHDVRRSSTVVKKDKPGRSSAAAGIGV